MKTEQMDEIIKSTNDKLPAWITLIVIAGFFLVVLGPFIINSAADNIRAIRNLVAAIKGN